MRPGFEIDHVGIAVKSIEEAAKLYRNLGWTSFDIEEVAREKVRVAFVRFENQANVELLEPTSKDSTIQKFLDRRGEGLHHICYRVKDLKRVLADLKKEGVRLIHEEPFRGAHNRLVAFVHPASCSGVLVELSQPTGAAEANGR